MPFYFRLLCCFLCPLWWMLSGRALTCHTKIFILCAHSHISIHLSLLWNFLLLTPRIFLLGPWPAYQAIHYHPWLYVYSHLGPFLLPHKVNAHVYQLKSLVVVKIFSQCCLSTSPPCIWDCNVASIYCQLSPTFWVNLFASQTQVFSSHFSWACGVT